ncbi:hypothetical protein [Jiangella anatolica]|uniref:Uncharacterized protein n=1 Tax=Jiangella anatolica TaxID=2670374 RepID=A0A2W2B9F3_9ACTN|nr:hypothetical protein [Jiangella anatolica]PZF82712.1 hypothetical protein C1I92_15770 [Jiangella anatolica]
MSDGGVDVGALVVTVLLTPLVVFGLVLTIKMWRERPDRRTTTKPGRRWARFGNALGTADIRSLPGCVAALALLQLGLVASLLEDALSGSASRAAGRLTVWLGAGFVAMLAITAGVVLFNRPRIAVPPAARDEPGALPLWWRSRRKRPRSG